MTKIYTTFTILSLLSFNSLAIAEDNPAAIPTIQVSGVRTHLVPYKEFYAMARDFQLATQNRVALGLRLIPSGPNVRIDDVKLWLEADDDKIQVPVSEGGVFVIPVHDEIASHDGQFAINKRKGEMKALRVIIPAVARDAWTIGIVRKSISDARMAVAKFTPWYQRALSMRINTVSVCTKQPGASVQIRHGDAIVETLKTMEKARNDADQPVYCQHFTGSENYDPSTEILIPQEAEVLFL